MQARHPHAAARCYASMLVAARMQPPLREQGGGGGLGWAQGRTTSRVDGSPVLNLPSAMASARLPLSAISLTSQAS